MVLESYCGYRSWDLKELWNSDSLVIPPCLSDTILLWLAVGFICCSLPFSVYSLRSSLNNKLPWTLLLLAKLSIGVLLIVSSAYELINALIDLFKDKISYPTDYLSPAFKLFSYFISLWLQLMFRLKGVNTSTSLAIYWLLMSIYSLVNVISLIIFLNHSVQPVWSFDKTDTIIKSLQTSGSICQLFLYWFLEPSKNSSSKYIQNECPYVRSSLSSKLFFSWFDSMAISGFRKTLTQSDLWNLMDENKTTTIETKIDSHFKADDSLVKAREDSKTTQSESKTHQPSQLPPNVKINILKVLMKSFWPTFVTAALCKFISSLLVFANPQLLDALLAFIVSKQPLWKGYIIAAGMFTSSLVQSICESQYEFWIQTLSLRIRSALIATIYKKNLKLSSLGKRDYTSGEIVNIMAVDAQRVIDYVNIVNLLWSSPLQLGITIYLLWRQLGVSSLAGLSVILFLVPYNGFVSTRFRYCQLALMKAKDARSKLVSEVLNGMKVLKLYAWEGAFGDIIGSIRRKEIKYLKSQAIWMAGITFAFSSTPFLITIVSFATYVLIDKSHILDANKAFVSISLINILGMPLGFLPIVVTYGASFLISVKRINKYLEGDELDTEAISHEPNPEIPIKVENANFSWSPEEDPVLKDIDIEVTKKSLVAVVGTVGCGKSSLLSALLGDLYKKQGSVNVYGKVAYVPQSSWIQNATVRENILFDSPFVRDKYETIIDACALGPDLKILAGGDATEIGEKGINVSGGQKQRISIARATYSNSDIYLLDDPLSAVDAHVAKHLFDRVIGPKGLLKNKTRLLVTHRITFLPQVDQIIVLKDGRVRESGTYVDLMAKKGEFFNFIVQYLAEQKNELDPDEQNFIQALNTEVEKKISLTKSESVNTSGVFPASDFRRRQTSLSSQGSSKTSPVDKNLDQYKLIETENAEKGAVKFKVYLEYIVATGVKSVCVTLIFFTILSGFNLGTSLWLTAWSDDSLDFRNWNNTDLRNKRLFVYGALGTCETMFILASTLVMSISVVNGSRLIHEKMLSRLIQAPMSFYDSTPLGRILNRFTKDIDSADTAIGFNLRMFASQFFRSIVSIIIISRETPYLIIVILILGLAYILIQKIYIASSRQLRRIEGVTRSPIYSHFTETVTGSTSIRAYQSAGRFTSEMYRLVDVNNSSSFTNVVANRWLSIRLEFLGNIIVTLTAIFAVITRGSSSPGSTGLSISYALQITGILNMLVRTVSEIENNLVSIERCLEYTKVPTEAPWVVSSHRPKKSWPYEGQISFNRYSTRYRPDLDLVLRDITFSINPSEKVGIVGRTGAGKSSLTLALFRLIEPSSGSITIDEEDISHLGLHDLRSRLTVIPQDPVLFSGSFRRNFDPFDKYSDSEIWYALEQAHLKDFVDTLDNGLDHEIAEGGENLSVGQRQLVCLTRALLRKSKILVLDEATAAVDVETDELIQQTIRQEFKDCTIVTIAHRLNTIIDYDKVIVMEKGQIIEYDSPGNLLNNDNSTFYQMAKDAKLV